MAPFFKKKSQEDPARQRYPEALWPLLVLGKPNKQTDYNQLAVPLAGYISELIQMALDEDLNLRYENDVAVWAPLHAMEILGVLGAVEAAEPLSQCLDWDDEWVTQALPGIYANIGPASIPILQSHLEDAGHNVWGRICAVDCLSAVAQAHPEQKDAVVRYLTGYLDRPSADDSADEETVTSFIISDLVDLEAREAYPAIKRAYEEDRVNPTIIGLEDVEIAFGMRPPRSPSSSPPDEPGVRLELKCKVCGRERSYLFPKVYCDTNTITNKKKNTRYPPIVIPQRVICSKCGAVDQYELTAMAYAAITADLLARTTPGLKKFRRKDQYIQYVSFQAMGRDMHPLEAVEQYQAKIARHPKDRDLYLGYGNVLRVLGRFEEARAQYQQAIELAPFNPDVYVEMGILALMEGDKDEALSLMEQALQVILNAPFSQKEKNKLKQIIQGVIRDIQQDKIDDIINPFTMAKPQTDKPHHSAPKPEKRKASPQVRLPKARTASRIRVGRNDPCPCGSGKKYKHCCMKKQK